MTLDDVMARSLLANHLVTDDRLDYAKELDWSSDEDVAERLAASNSHVPRRRSVRISDFSHSDVLRGPSEARKIVFDSLQQRFMPSSDNAPAPHTNVDVVGFFEGVVTSVGTDSFEAKFVPLGKSEPTFSGEFLIEEVDDDDLELVRRDALFHVIAGKIEVSNRHWQSTSTIRFRRIPRVQPERVAAAVERAKRIIAERRSAR